MKRKFTWLAISLACALVMAIPANASTAVNVKLRISLASRTATKASCDLSIPAGANGIAVLDAAVSSGCISSYKTEDFGFGRYVSCIDEICEQLGTYWAMYENGAYTSYGISDFVADQNDELGFNYEQYLTCFLPTGC